MCLSLSLFAGVFPEIQQTMQFVGCGVMVSALFEVVVQSQWLRSNRSTI